MSGRASATAVAALLASLALVLLVAAPAARVWGLDLEALVYNTYLDWTTDYSQRWYARRSWIPGLQGLLTFGVCGLTMLVGFGGFLRLFSLAPGSAGRELRNSARVRRLGLALSILCVVAGAFPVALAFAMSLAVELYPWIEWHRTVDPLMESVHGPGVWLVLPSLLVGGLLASRWAYSGPAAAPATGAASGVLVAALKWLALLVLLAPLAVTLPTATARVVRAAPSLDGEVIFARECGACHERALPLYYIKAPAEWNETVATHRRVEGVELSETEALALREFLEGVRSFGDAWTFRTRCQNCHGSSWGRWEPRTVQDWEAIAERLSRWSPYFYGGPVREQLVEHLSATKVTKMQDFGLPAKEAELLREVYAECDDCHSVSYEAKRYQDEPREEIEAMVRRMGQKLAEPYDQQQLERFVDGYRSLISDPDRFDRMFPHDRPEHTGGGL